MTNIDHDALARRIAERLARNGFILVPEYSTAERTMYLVEKCLEIALREVLPTSEPIETGWLIERKRERGPEWAVFGAFGVEWTKDSNKACRFARREDAEQLAYGEDCDAVTEHMWAWFETREQEQPKQLTPEQVERAKWILRRRNEIPEELDSIDLDAQAFQLLREVVGE